MSDELRWQVTEGCLTLSGELDRETLLPLWQQREQVMQQVSRIDLQGLSHVDTAGLALLVHLRQAGGAPGRALQFTGVTEKQRSLIGLYNLQQLLVSAD